MILTEHTAQITAGEKDGSGAGSTGNTGLLPIMQGGSRCHELGGLPTVPGLPGETVNMARSQTSALLFEKAVVPEAISVPLPFMHSYKYQNRIRRTTQQLHPVSSRHMEGST